MQATSFTPEETRVIGKVSRRLLWFMLLLFMVNFVDRTNIGFAALTMNKDIGINASTFALSLTFFAVAYFLCEIPSNLILEKVGARLWLARIAVTWGIVSTACMFVVGAKSLITLRILLGIAEAGFAPGAVLYMTYWFPQFFRSRAHSNFMVAQPIALALGATMSGLLLGLNGILGLAGWRWLFFIEGVPSIILGVIAFFYLTDKPKDAKWLTAGERQTLISCLERDAAERDRRAPVNPLRSVTREILRTDFQLVCFGYGCVIGNISAMGSWMPQIIRGFSGPDMPYWTIGLLTAIPSVAALIVMPFWNRSADRRKERFWHCVIPMIVGVGGWTMATGLDNHVLQLAGLVIANVCLVSAWPVFFTLPSMMLPPKAHAAGIAYLNVIGIAGTSISPLIMGAAKDLTGSFVAGMVAVSVFLALGAVAMFFVPRRAITIGEGDAAAPASAAAQ